MPTACLLHKYAVGCNAITLSREAAALIAAEGRDVPSVETLLVKLLTNRLTCDSMPSEPLLTRLFGELYARLVLRSVPPKAGLLRKVAYKRTSMKGRNNYGVPNGTKLRELWPKEHFIYLRNHYDFRSNSTIPQPPERLNMLNLVPLYGVPRIAESLKKIRQL